MSEVTIHDLAVVGAGWAGIAAAVEATRLGARVVLVDAASAPGGRARNLSIDADGQALALDNGQHLLVGAYRETLDLAELVHAPAAIPARRLPMRLLSVDGLDLRCAALPAPFHLAVGVLRAKGLLWSSRWAMARLMRSLKRRSWQLPSGQTVTQLLQETSQPASLVQRIWEPLCIAALNTAPEQACARTFASVLRDTLGADARASDFVLPTVGLGDFLPIPALRWLDRRGAAVRLSCPVRALHRSEDAWQLDGHGARIAARAVVLAVPPRNAERLLEPLVGAAALAPLRAFRFEPITTVYLGWPASVVASLPDWIMLAERIERRQFGQWLFDRGVQGQLRCAAVVVSARGRQWLASSGTSGTSDRAGAVAGPTLAEVTFEMGAAADVGAVSAGQPYADNGPTTGLAHAIGVQVSEQLGLPAPVFVRAIVDKRATFICTPDRPRLQAGSLSAHLPGLAVAGDHVWPDYPATLEAAVRSGRAAARMLIEAASPES